MYTVTVQVQHFMMYDAITMLAAVPVLCREHFRSYTRHIGSETHSVIGALKSQPGIVDIGHLRESLIELLLDGLARPYD